MTVRRDPPPAAPRRTTPSFADILPRSLRELSLGAVRGVPASRCASPDGGGPGSIDSREWPRTLRSGFADRLTLHPEYNVAEQQREPETRRVGSCR